MAILDTLMSHWADEAVAAAAVLTILLIAKSRPGRGQRSSS